MLVFGRRPRLKVEGESSDSLRRRSFLEEDQMDFLNPLGEAVEDLSRNSVAFVVLNEAYDRKLQSSKSNGDTNTFPEGSYLRACQCVFISIKTLVFDDSVPSSRLYGLLYIALQTIHFKTKMFPPRHGCEVSKFWSHKL